MKDIEVLGHRQIVFKSDSQAQREFAARQPEMMLKNSPKSHSAASGIVENAVPRIIGLTRVLQDALEANIKQTIEPNTPVMTFMASHAATIINRVSVDQHGRTPMEKARGTTANGRVRGEDIVPAHDEIQQREQTRREVATRALFMGVATRTNETMMSGRDGQERAGTFRRLREDKKWVAEAVMNAIGSPSGTEFELKITAGTINVELIDKPQARPVPVMPFRLRHKDIVQFGYTPECKGCRAARAGTSLQAHEEMCRTQN